MNPWQMLSDKIGTSDDLKDISTQQSEAIISILTLMMYADQRASVMEEAELEDLICSLPWFEDKDDVVEKYINGARKEMKGIADEGTMHKKLSKYAGLLSGQELRETVYRMAVTMAYSDMHLHVNEVQLLRWMAAEFEIEEERALQIQSEQGF
ncbi:TerB family tellurite resistance protein [Myxococcota bacterium]|nr:TerB family tellurite resistance protein [Myxococcota bacterium]